jgi:adenosylmethionine-8-amino-7-oxononanoate aminotransferase
VFVAFGRLGGMLVCRDEGVAPDFLCLAKGLTAGYLPLAATLTGLKVFDACLGSYESGRAFFHGHTFTGNPLAAAVALENIRKLETLIDSGELQRRADDFGRLMDDTFSGRPGVRGFRQRGFAAAIDLQPAPGTQRVGLRVALRARSHGVLLRPLGDSLPLVPPLCLSKSELTELVERTRDAIDDVLIRNLT